jgi:integrase
LAPPPKGKRIEKRDVGGHNLYLLVQDSGSRSWAVRYGRGGKVAKLTLGPYPALSLAEARKRALEVAAAVGRGADPQGELMAAKAAAAAPAPTIRTVEMVAKEFLKRHTDAKNGARWAAEVKRYLDRSILPALGDKAIGAVTKTDIIVMVDKIAADAPIAANRVLAVASKLFRWSLGRDYVDRDPTAGIPKPGSEAKRDRVLTDDELARVWRAADGMGYPFGPAVKMLILTAARREEVGAMKWSEVDLAAKTWALPAARAKNQTEHIVPLSDAAVAILSSLPRIGRRDGFVFTVTGRTAISGWSNAKDRLDAASGVADWTLHDLRRSLATKVDALPHVVEAILGHVVKGVAGVYNRNPYAAEKREALDKWASRVAVIVGEPS